jgi:GT2 family glycosyltransferase
MRSVDVVVPTFNRPEPLRSTLGALAAQTHSDFRVIVVDDCSAVPVSQSLRTGDYPFELEILTTSRNSGPAAARNLAVEAANAEVIAFVDDDVVPVPEFLDIHLQVLDRCGRRSVSIGPLRAPADWQPTPWNRWEAQTIGVEYGKMARGEYQATWRQFFTGNAMLRRKAFQEAGGFDESFKRAEDIEFAYRLAKRGATFVFEPRAIGWHYAERSLQSWRKIPAQYAEFDVTIDTLHPELRWNRLVEREESRRHYATRTLQNVARALGAERPMASATIAVARSAHRASLHAASNKLLSVAYQLEYGKRRRELLEGRRFNTPSTATR